VSYFYKVILFVYYVTGPACNLFLRHLNFVIGPFSVDRFTSPGVCDWCLLSALFAQFVGV